VITDNVGGTNYSGLLTVNFTNRPPVANPDTYTVPTDSTNTFSVTTNDAVVTAGGHLSIVGVSTVDGIAIIVNSTNIQFEPTPGTVTGTVHYVLSDNVGGTNYNGLLTVNFTDVWPPIANPDYYTVAENTTNTFSVTTNDVVVSPGGILKVVAVTMTNGIATIVSDTDIEFIPTNNLATGKVIYTVIDQVGGTNYNGLLTVSFTNVPPIANEGDYTVAENTTNTFNVTVNDVSVQTPGGQLTILNVRATNGLATIDNGTNIVFAPTNNLATGKVFYAVSDNVGGTNYNGLLVVSFTNNPPVANPDTYTVPTDSTNTFSVTTNDAVQTPGGSLSIVSVSTGDGVANVVNGTNIYFAPTPGTVTGTINYTLSDKVGGTNYDGVVTVNFIDLPLVANPDIYTVAENTTNTFLVTTNDVMNGGSILNITSVNAMNGIATIVSGTNIMFAPTNNLAPGTVSYTLSDDIGNTTDGLLTINFTNNPPVANPDNYVRAGNTTNTFFVTTNDVVRTIGGHLTVVAVTMTNGIATIINSTNIQFAPTNGLATGTVGYTLSDNVGGTNYNGLLTVTFTNALPVASFTGIPTNGFVPLTVAFTNTSFGGSFTNSIWSFGDGNGITNTTGGNVTNIYASSGSFTVTLTIIGSGGSSTNKQINYIVVSPTNQVLATTLSANGKLVFNYTNGPIGVQYRILSSTNLLSPIASWTPIVTNTFPNSYTNGLSTNAKAFFRLVSP